jgi:hypothetical protein
MSHVWLFRCLEIRHFQANIDLDQVRLSGVGVAKRRDQPRAIPPTRERRT